MSIAANDMSIAANDMETSAEPWRISRGAGGAVLRQEILKQV